MLQIETLVFSPFQENTYVLWDETGDCVIVDPGCLEIREEQRLVAFIEQHNLKPVKLINTHLHLDHVFGSAFVADKWGLEIWAHRDDEFMIPNTVNHARNFGVSMNDNPPPVNHYISDGDDVTFGNTTLKVIHVPGHSPGGVAFYHQQSASLISGDILFRESVGRSDLPGGNHEQLIAGIMQKLMTLPDNVKVYPGHGPTTTIGWEKSHNSYL